MSAAPHDPALARRLRGTAAICLGVVIGMIGLAYAAVPLYDLFCRVTGFAGTPLRGSAGGAPVLDHTVKVRFDANVAPGLDWRFTPETPEIEARVGETQDGLLQGPQRRLGRGHRHRDLQRPARPGRRLFRQDPVLLLPGADAAGGRDHRVPGGVLHRAVHRRRAQPQAPESITLSYTYFASKNGQPVAATSAAATATETVKPGT